MLKKQALKAKASYFEIITPKYFSANLNSEWEIIVQMAKRKGPVFDGDGNQIVNAFANTIDQMTDPECEEIIRRIVGLHEKVKIEFA